MSAGGGPSPHSPSCDFDEQTTCGVHCSLLLVPKKPGKPVSSWRFSDHRDNRTVGDEVAVWRCMEKSLNVLTGALSMNPLIMLWTPVSDSSNPLEPVARLVSESVS